MYFVKVNIVLSNQTLDDILYNVKSLNDVLFDPS